jgi:hypothetical protein
MTGVLRNTSCTSTGSLCSATSCFKSLLCTSA